MATVLISAENKYLLNSFDPPPSIRVSPRQAYLRDHLVIWFIVIIVLLLPIIIFGNNTTDLNPSHSSEIDKISLTVATTMGLFTLILMIWIKPKVRGSLFTATIALPFVLFALSLMASSTIADTVYEQLDFSGPYTVRGFNDFALRRVYLTSGKRTCYRAELTDFLASFCLSRSDFDRAKMDFLNGRNGRYCLHVEDEENGSAIRIMHSTSHTLAPGALIRCQIGTTTSIG